MRTHSINSVFLQASTGRSLYQYPTAFALAAALAYAVDREFIEADITEAMARQVAALGNKDNAAELMKLQQHHAKTAFEMMNTVQLWEDRVLYIVNLALPEGALDKTALLYEREAAELIKSILRLDTVTGAIPYLSFFLETYYRNMKAAREADQDLEAQRETLRSLASAYHSGSL